MRETNDGSEETSRRGYLKGIAGAGMTAGLLPTMLGGTGTAADETATETTSVDEDDVYLVFGADTSSTDLGSWVEDHVGRIRARSQRSSAPVLQYQDVTQLNVSQRDNAVAVSVDGGRADAIQRAQQSNENTQSGDARSINVPTETTDRTFEDVGAVYVVFAEETDCREFSGWVVSDDAYQAEQSAEATVEQKQEIDQLNYSSQSIAVALAEDGSCSKAHQRSFQKNENSQTANAVASDVGSGSSQSASSGVLQAQNVDQLNAAEQGVAVAIAVGPESLAEARQVTHQLNVNEQVADATAVNFDPRSIERVTASAGLTGDFSAVDLTRSNDDGSGQSNVQAASAEIDQFQDVAQTNVSMQNAAVAVGLGDSRATATQVSYQANFNAQVADAAALNVDVGQFGARRVMSGQNAQGDDSWAVSFENGGSPGDEQLADVDIEQIQIVEQLNESNQTGAIAVAINDGRASAEQLNAQVNRNAQAAESVAANVDVSAREGC